MANRRGRGRRAAPRRESDTNLRRAFASSGAGAVRRRVVSGRGVLDLALVVVLSVIAIAGFGAAFDDAGFLLAGVGGLIVGVGAAVLGTRLGLGALATVILAIAGYFVLGTAFAVPEEGVYAVIPTLSSIASLAIGAVFGWADLLTLRAPVELPDYVTAVPYAAAWLVGLIGALLVVRWMEHRRRTVWTHALLLAGPLSLYALSVLFGTEQPVLAAVRGVGFTAIALGWIAWHRFHSAGADIALRRGMLRRNLASATVLVVAASVLGLGGGMLLTPSADDRFVLRDEIVPPSEQLDFPSPLAGFRKYTKDLTDTVLFSVRGLEPGQRIRLATMDSYDGVLWNVAGVHEARDGSGSFTMVGTTFPEPQLLTPGAEARLEVTVAEYGDVWIPGVGYPSQVSLDGDDSRAREHGLRYNAATGSAVLIDGLAEGDAYRLTAQTQLVPATEQLLEVPTANVELPPVSTIPDIVVAKAGEFAGGATTPIEQLRAIEQTMATTGFLSHGAASDSAPSRAGHGADRMVELFERSQMVGDEEQYASAFALMARSLGYPARVVMGFAPEVAEGAVSVDVVGDDVTAWAEVAFEDVGWLPFMPTPEQTDVPQDEVPQPQSEPQPQVRQPPRSENETKDLLTPVDIDDSDTDDEDPFGGIPGWVIVGGLSIVAVLIIVLVPMLIVTALKSRRLRRRRGAAAADASIAGAWEELLDRYSELGFDVPTRVTRTMAAASLEQQVGEHATGRVLGIAALADDAVFSGREVPDAERESVWNEAHGAVELARLAVSRGRRILSRYRLSSVRRWAGTVVDRARVDARDRGHGNRAHWGRPDGGVDNGDRLDGRSTPDAG
ncbi:transglutaminaseTgpA domain-containing protein [Ruicaihuangia caeni]|uniref:transglutaminase family protein n=1 Tax=Ruicaihuangia caeni TaxID=3042517 RepID=UPI00338FB395